MPIEEDCESGENRSVNATEISNDTVEVCEPITLQDEDGVVQQLNIINLLNVIGFLVTVLNFILIMRFEFSSEFLSYDKISKKYMTIITPKSSAKVILVVEFMLKLAFVATQLIPDYRGTKLVQEGVGYWYMIISVLQFGWTWAFFKENMHLSIVLMFFILASSIIIVYAQRNITSTSQGLHQIREFIMIRLPFQIYCGIAIAVMAIHISICAVKESEPASSLITLAVITFTIFHSVSMFCTLGLKTPLYTIPFVLAWVLFWIFQELKDPYILIYIEFDLDTIRGLRNSALTISVLCVLKVPIHFLSKVKLSEPQND